MNTKFEKYLEEEMKVLMGGTLTMVEVVIPNERSYKLIRLKFLRLANDLKRNIIRNVDNIIEEDNVGEIWRKDTEEIK